MGRPHLSALLGANFAGGPQTSNKGSPFPPFKPEAISSLAAAHIVPEEAGLRVISDAHQAVLAWPVIISLAARAASTSCRRTRRQCFGAVGGWGQVSTAYGG